MRLKSVRSKDQPSTSGTRSCLVCSDKSASIHFGVYTCRACAAFFRRCVVLKREYKCREDGNCDTKVGCRNMCRKCRLSKCFEVGMLIEGIQSNRDPIVSKSSDLEPLSACSPSIYSSEIETLSACPSVAKHGGPHSGPEQMEFLTTIETNYVSLCSTRRATEISMCTDALREVLKDGKMPTEIFATFTRIKNSRRAHIPAYINFMKNTFPEMMELSEEERHTIIEHCVLVFWTLDAAYKTYKKVKEEDAYRKIFFSETLCISRGKLPEFLHDTPIDWTEFLRMMYPYIKNRFHRSWELRDLKLDNMEYYALLVHTLWSQSMINVTDGIIALGVTIRNRVNKQLHWWYMSEGNKDYAERMCSILFFVNPIMRYIEKENESVELLDLLNLLDD